MGSDIRFSMRRRQQHSTPDPRRAAMERLLQNARDAHALAQYRRVRDACSRYVVIYNGMYEDMQQMPLELVRLLTLALQGMGLPGQALKQYLLTAHDMSLRGFVRTQEMERTFYREALACAELLRSGAAMELFRKKLHGMVVKEFGLRDVRTHRDMLMLAGFLEQRHKHREAADYRLRAVAGAVARLNAGTDGR